MENKMELIEKYIEAKEQVLSFGSGENAFDVMVNDHVSVDTLSAAANEIARMVAENDFDYSLLDIAMSYFIIDLFTDIPIPMAGDSSDYVKCHDICCRMNLVDELCAVSANIENSIAYLEKNVWRKLEYLKTIEANSALTMVCGKLYDVLDSVENIVDKVAEVDMQALMEELNEVTGQLAAETTQNN